MTRLLLITAVCLLAVSASVASAVPPGPPPPKTEGGPPAAWLEKPGTDRWLAYSSFCWKTTCVDFLPPDTRPDLPRIQLAPGTVVRFHLGYRPTSLRLARFGGGRTWQLAAAHISSWKMAARGMYVLEARAAAGSASYVFRIT